MSYLNLQKSTDLLVNLFLEPEKKLADIERKAIEFYNFSEEAQTIDKLTRELTDRAKSPCDLEKFQKELHDAKIEFNKIYNDIKKKKQEIEEEVGWDRSIEIINAVTVVELFNKVEKCLNRITEGFDWKPVGIVNFGNRGDNAMLSTIHVNANFELKRFYFNPSIWGMQYAAQKDIVKADVLIRPMYRLYVYHDIQEILNVEDGEPIPYGLTRKEIDLYSEDDSGWYFASLSFDKILEILAKLTINNRSYHV